MFSNGRISVALGVGIATLGFAASASAASFSGVVVHKEARAHSFVIALRGGGLRAIHARRSPALGTRVTVDASALRNGTWAMQRLTRSGSANTRVRVRGTVTYVNSRQGLFVVSARGVSLLVHDRRARLRGAHIAADTTVSDGGVVTVDGSLAGDSIDAIDVQSDGQDVNGIDLEATVQAVDTAARTLTVSADDSGESGSTLVVDVPASFDIGAFSDGESLEMVASPNGDGTYTLEQVSDDGGAQTANNPGDNQGDGHGDQHASAAQVCETAQSDPNFAATHNNESFVQFWETDPNNPNNALGMCIDAMAHGTAASPSPELACHLEASDPSFAAAHSGATFAQFYNPQDPSNLNDAFGQCVNAKAQQQDGGSSDSQNSGSHDSTGGSGSDSSTTGGSGSDVSTSSGSDSGH